MLLMKRKTQENKREKVLERKTKMGEKLSEVMHFVNDQDNVWQLIGNEQTFKQDIGERDIFSIGLTKKDILDLEKK